MRLYLMHHLRMQWCRTINTLFHIFYDLFIFSFALITCVNYMRFEQLFSIIVYRKNNDRLNWNSVMHDESLYTRMLNFIPESNRRFPNFYVVNFNKYYLYYAKWSSSRIMRHVRACAHDSLFFFIRWHFLFSLFVIYIMIDSTRIQTIAERVSQYRKLLNLTFRLLLSATCSRLLS